MEMSFSNKFQALNDDELYSMNGGDIIIAACIIGGLFIIACAAVGWATGVIKAENEIHSGKW